MEEVKFKIYDKNKKKLLNGTGYSITGDGEVQTFNNHGLPEGTIKNRHLKPVLYTGKKDCTGRNIYDGFIIERKYNELINKDMIGVVKFKAGQWVIEDKIYETSTPLFDEKAIDRIIGDIYEGVE